MSGMDNVEQAMGHETASRVDNMINNMEVAVNQLGAATDAWQSGIENEETMEEGSRAILELIYNLYEFERSWGWIQYSPKNRKGTFRNLLKSLHSAAKR